jgi:hypothetical protein
LRLAEVCEVVKQILHSPWTGAVFALVSIAWEAFWLIGPPVGVGSSERKWYLFWGLVALTVSGSQAFFVLIRKNRHLAVKLDEKHKIKRAKEAIGKLLEQLAQCEREAYNGSDGRDFDRLRQQIEQIKLRVRQIATEYLDTSFESRFLAVNVLDVQLDEPTKTHFIARAQGDFWTMYQQLKGWRACLVDIIKDLDR